MKNSISRPACAGRTHLSFLLASATLIGCATSKTYEKVRVAILDINGAGGASIVRDGHEESMLDMAGVRAVLENELLKQDITVVDDAELKAVLKRYGDSLVLGIHTTATTPEEYQPAATHGIIVNIQENVGLLTALTLGLMPHTIDTTARLIDLRDGEVRASVHTWSIGSIFSSGGAYRGVRKVTKEIAARLRQIQDDGRHLHEKDWPTEFQRASPGRFAGTDRRR